uniref:Uncharacterized protein n=1 Tax=Anguilla anguilla TaxID=7936 RepID=A0A0E9UVU0_ANGAN
MTEAQRKAR